MNPSRSILTDGVPLADEAQAALDAIRFGQCEWPANLTILARSRDKTHALVLGPHKTTLIDLEPA